MPVDWVFAGDILRMGGVDSQKIAPDGGARQQDTARSILGDFQMQPGVILADEGGMQDLSCACGGCIGCSGDSRLRAAGCCDDAERSGPQVAARVGTVQSSVLHAP
jgi:hypothetical protein